jgi:hypothetical protein
MMNENEVEYLLDTSIFRGLSAAKFYSIPKSITLVASPYCFWELLPHLDEPEEFIGFKRRMMRFKKVWVLDRAWKEFETRSNASEMDDRLCDNDIIDATLAALEASESLGDFYECVIQDTNGTLRQILDCCTRAREFLGRDEQRFLSFVHEISVVISKSNDGYRTPEQQHRGVLGLIDGFFRTKKQALGNSDYVQIIHRTYFYHAYVFMLAVRHAREGRIPKANDYRDAELCKHLAPGGGLCLVTIDTEVQRGLRTGCDLLRSQGIADLDLNEVVISPTTFEQQI